MIPPFLPSQALIKERGDSDEENRQCLYVCVSIFFNRKQMTTHGNWNIRGSFPASCPHCHSMGTYALNITHVPFSFPEVPPFGSPCLSHTSQPQPQLSYKKEAWDQESSPSPAGPDHKGQTQPGRSLRRALSPPTAPGTHNSWGSRPCTYQGETQLLPTVPPPSPALCRMTALPHQQS